MPGSQKSIGQNLVSTSKKNKLSQKTSEGRLSQIYWRDEVEDEERKRIIWPFLMELIVSIMNIVLYYCNSTDNTSFIGLLIICEMLVSLPAGVVGIVQVLKRIDHILHPNITTLLSVANILAGLLMLLMLVIVIIIE